MTTQSDMCAIFNEDEIEVCNILVDLKNIIRQSESHSLSKLLSGWGVKRQRSNRNLNEGVSPVTSLAVVNSSSPSPTFPHKASHGDNEIQTTGQKLKTEAATSPATPLSFSPSESDEKQKHSSRKHCKKKSREEWLRIIEELSQCKETLTRELENVMMYYNDQKAYNLKLKEELLRISHERGEPNTEPTMRSETGFGPSSVLNVAQHNPQEQQSVAYEMRTGTKASQRFAWQLGQMDQVQGLSSYKLGLANYHVGPFGIPDLNLPAEQISGGTVDSPQPYDIQRLWADSKARYAEARRNRKIKNSMKIRKASGLITLANRR